MEEKQWFAIQVLETNEYDEWTGKVLCTRTVEAFSQERACWQVKGNFKKEFPETHFFVKPVGLKESKPKIIIRGEDLLIAISMEVRKLMKHQYTVEQIEEATSAIFSKIDNPLEVLRVLEKYLEIECV